MLQLALCSLILGSAPPEDAPAAPHLVAPSRRALPELAAIPADAAEQAEREGREAASAWARRTTAAVAGSGARMVVRPSPAVAPPGVIEALARAQGNTKDSGRGSPHESVASALSGLGLEPALENLKRRLSMLRRQM